MELAILTFYKIVSMFIILFVGVLCYKLKFITAEGNKTLSNILLFIVSPCVMLMAFQRDYKVELVEGLLFGILFTIITHIIGIVLNLIFFRKGSKDYEVNRMSALYSNCGFIGIPIISAVLGGEGVFFLAGYILVFNVFLWTHGFMTITNTPCDSTAIKTVATNPVIIFAFIGILLFFLRIKLPSMVGDGVQFIADMNTPLAMLIAGASIAQANPVSALKKYRSYIACFVKLLGIPLLTIAALVFLPGAKIVKLMCVIATACPSAASTTMFAIRYGKDDVYASQLYAISTILSIITVPLMVSVAQIFIK